MIQIRRIKQQVDDRLKKKDDADLRAIANRLTRELTVVEEEVYQVKNQSNQDPLNFPIKINNRLASLLRVVETGDGRPTSNTGAIFNDIKGELKARDRPAAAGAHDRPAGVQSHGAENGAGPGTREAGETVARGFSRAKA